MSIGHAYVYFKYYYTVSNFGTSVVTTITSSLVFCNNLQLQCKLVVPLCILTSLLQIVTTGRKSSQHLYTIHFDFLIVLVKMNVELNLVF